MLTFTQQRAVVSRRSTAMPRARQQGLSIVELMVGVALGLFIVAGASLLASTQIRENRKLMSELLIQQDLRAAADIITRDLRRAGSWQVMERTVWWKDEEDVVISQFRGMTPSSAGSETKYRYRRELNKYDFGFRLNNGRIQTYLSSSGWQDLTDKNTVEITSFVVTPIYTLAPSAVGAQPAKLPCPKLCPDGTTDCWPTTQMRQFKVEISGRLVNDNTVERSVRSVARIRGDEIQLNGLSAPICPA